MVVVALTGGIASGKSLVATMFQHLGIDIIDTDALARELVAPGKSAYQAIQQRFGAAMIDAQGELDRRQLRQWIFTHPEDKIWLEALLHPAILQLCSVKLQQCHSPYAIIVIPLLAETWEKYAYPMIDRICVVDCAEALQIARLIERDDLTVAQAENSLRQQATRQERIKLADDLIHNDDSEEQLQDQVEQLHEQYLLLSKNQ